MEKNMRNIQRQSYIGRLSLRFKNKIKSIFRIDFVLVKGIEMLE